jgi:hypothetical protein
MWLLSQNWQLNEPIPIEEIASTARRRSCVRSLQLVVGQAHGAQKRIPAWIVVKIR